MTEMPSLDELIQAIREEATGPQYQLATPHPLLSPPELRLAPATGAPVTPALALENALAAFPPAERPFHVDELLLISDSALFVEAAYQALLNRPADAYGSQSYLEKLSQGFGQAFVLAGLRASEEGQRANVRLAGFGLAPWVYNTWRVGRRLGLETPARWLCNAYSAWRHVRLAASGRLLTRMNQMAPRVEQLRIMQIRAAQQLGDLGQRQSQESERVNRLAAAQEDSTQRMDALKEHSERHLDAVTVTQKQIIERNEQQQENTEHRLDQIATALEHNGNRLNEVARVQQERLDQLEQQQQTQFVALATRVSQSDKTLAAFEKQIKFEVQLLRARVLTLQQRAQAVPDKKVIASESQEVSQLATASAGQLELDAYYLAFENAHRGSQEEITKKITPYLPYVAALPEGILALPMVDVGCGRGEWLELLREHGFNAMGLDISPAMVQHCQERGLRVELANVSDWFARQADDSCALITGFHIIEHIPFAQRLHLVGQALRVLAPGGALILETPNPESVLVGSHTFYHDYTHSQPITPTSLQFLLGYQGFVSLTILRLNPYPSSDRVQVEGLLAERLNGHLYGPQDFSVIGYKA
jgi:SAM-dependent methyltransferase